MVNKWLKKNKNLLIILGLFIIGITSIIYYYQNYSPRGIVKNYLLQDISYVFDCGLVEHEFNSFDDVPLPYNYTAYCSSVLNATHFFEYNACHRCEDVGCSALYFYEFIFSDDERVLGVFLVDDTGSDFVSRMWYCYGDES